MAESAVGNSRIWVGGEGWREKVVVWMAACCDGGFWVAIVGELDWSGGGEVLEGLRGG